MTMNEPYEGGCVCGSVRYRAVGEPHRVTICHCQWCQRRTGSAFGVECVFDEALVEFSGETIRDYRHASDESGRWLNVRFCHQCGSNLGFTLEAVPGIRTIAAGTLDDPSRISADRLLFRHVFTRSHRDWSIIPDQVERHEALPVSAPPRRSDS
jgi:hypothetical protein